MYSDCKNHKNIQKLTHTRRKRISFFLAIILFLTIAGPLDFHVEDAHAADHSNCKVCRGTGMVDCPKTPIRADTCHQWACWPCGQTGLRDAGTYPCYTCNPQHGEWSGWTPYPVDTMCTNCVGTGKLICMNCNNTGKGRCSSCNARYPDVMYCTTCNKTGTSACLTCDGAATRSCPPCWGTGTVTVDSNCPTCGNQGLGGYVGAYKECENCGGNGWVYCFHCEACGRYNDYPEHINHNQVPCSATPPTATPTPAITKGPEPVITAGPSPTPDVDSDTTGKEEGGEDNNITPPLHPSTVTPKPTSAPAATETPTRIPTPSPLPTATPTPSPTPRPINITANPNNGEESYTIRNIPYGSSKGRSLYDEGVPVPEKLGYTLDKWTAHQNGRGSTIYYSNGIAANDGSYWWRNKNTASRSYSVYAQWIANQYSILLNPPNATQDPIIMDLFYDEEYLLPASPFTNIIKVSYNKNTNDFVYMEKMSEFVHPSFDGWSYETNGHLAFEDRAAVKNLTAKQNDVINLYTRWKDNVITLYTPTRIGHKFLGWTTTKDGSGALYKGGATYTVTENVCFYAQWSKSKYNVSFEPNGGSPVTPTRKEVTYGEQYGSLPTTNKTGHTFVAWVYNYTNPITASSRVNVAQDHTLVAAWMPNEYQLVADPNGGILKGSTAPVDLGALIYGATNNNHAPVPTRDGYFFLGWYDSRTGGNLIYDKNGAFVGDRTRYFNTSNLFIGSEDVTIYAQWKVEEYVVTFDANEGSCSVATKTIPFGQTYGALPTPTREGYSFCGWYYDTSVQILGNMTLRVNKNHTLVARWEIETYTVSFDWNFNYNRTVTDAAERLFLKTNYVSNSKKVAYNETYGTLPVPSRKGYTFLGWYMSEDGNNGTGIRVTDDTLIKKRQDHMLYAQWTANTYTVFFDYNYNWLPYYPK